MCFDIFKGGQKRFHCVAVAADAVDGMPTLSVASGPVDSIAL